MKAWYVKYKHKLLSVYDRYLAQFDLATIHRMDRHTRAAWVRHLDITREAYNIELQQKAKGRNVITRYCTFRNPAIKSTQPGPAEEELQSEFFIGPSLSLTAEGHAKCRGNHSTCVRAPGYQSGKGKAAPKTQTPYSASR